MRTAKGMFITLAFLSFWTLAGQRPAIAADRGCTFSFVERPALLQRASFKLAGISKGNVKVTFIGHSTFALETSTGVTVATDINGIHTPNVPPLIATMNNSHSSHYTGNPDPKISYVLGGWDPNSGVAKHNIKGSCTR